MELSNGKVVLQKEKRLLYKQTGANWVKVEEEEYEVVNGDMVAISLNKEA